MTYIKDAIYEITWNDGRKFIGVISGGWVLCVGDKTPMLWQHIEPYVVKKVIIKQVNT